MLKALDIDRQTVAYLQNATKVSYEKQTNNIWSASFCLPLDDPKVDKVQLLGFVEIEDNDGEVIGLFRVMPSETTFSVESKEVKFECKHVLSLLMDSVMFRYHEIKKNTTTTQVLQYLLGLQKVKHWKLGVCEFTRYFQYSWENENGLIDAIWSIPQPFDEEYMWTFDTSSYPWTINLVKPPTDVTARVWEGHNLKGFKVETNPNQTINRIYPLGQGEGVNQLNIKKVNPTGQYYVEDASSIAKYGLIEYVWADTRFTDAQSLYSSTVALLKRYKQPLVTWHIDATDLIKAVARKPGQKVPKIDELRLDKVIQVKTNKFGKLNLRILKESKSDMFGNPQDIQLTVGYVPSDLGTTQADIERNIEINQLYSQGATNILNYDKADNADSDYPVKFRLFIDDDVSKINTCELTYETSPFRAYSKGTAGGGGSVQSTSSGGGSVQSSTSEAAGQSTNTSSANGSHRHKMFTFEGVINHEWGAANTANVFMGYNRNMPIYVDGSSQTGDLYTAEAADNHTHSVTTPAHQHNVTINIPNHVHTINVPAHTHDIEYGIFEDSSTANQIVLTVDGNVVPGTNTSRERFDIVSYLSKQEDGTINRGWHEITMKPNRRARIEAQITMRVFIKSQLGGDF